MANNPAASLTPPSPAALTASAAASNRGFNLPPGWFVQEVLRSDGSKHDKYYLEPGTERKYRSQRDVERHLKGEVVSRSRRRPRGRPTTQPNRSQPASQARQTTTNNSLMETPPPPMDRHQQQTNECCFETGSSSGKQKFKSVAEIEDSQEEEKNADVAKVTSEAGEVSFGPPPKKVNWVLASSRGDSWDAFIGETKVPNAVREAWNQRLMTFLMTSNNVGMRNNGHNNDN